jgi:propanediol dehydratase small subunit
MTNLSPAAKPVWDAYEELLEYECVVTRTDVKALAAALRAAADQVVPEETWLETKEPCYAYYCQRSITRRQLLAIADELETQA